MSSFGREGGLDSTYYSTREGPLMKLFFDEAVLAHVPTQFMVAGRIVAPVENPDRAQTLSRALMRGGLELMKPADAGLAPIHAVHAEHYATFLRDAPRGRALGAQDTSSPVQWVSSCGTPGCGGGGGGGCGGGGGGGCGGCGG